MTQDKEQKHDCYIGVDDSLSKRREILESSRMAIHMLQDFERLIFVRTEKDKLTKKLSSLLKEIYSLVTKLKSELPKIPTTKKTKSVKKGKASTKESKESIVVPKKKSQLDLLEDELKNVEKQLNELA